MTMMFHESPAAAPWDGRFRDPAMPVESPCRCGAERPRSNRLTDHSVRCPIYRVLALRGTRPYLLAAIAAGNEPLDGHWAPEHVRDALLSAPDDRARSLAVKLIGMRMRRYRAAGMAYAPEAYLAALAGVAR